MNKKKIIVSLIIFIVVGIVGFVLFKIFIYDGIINSPERRLLFDNDGWKYDAKNHVYYKIGLDYVMNPSSDYERLNIYVPGDYLICSSKKDNVSIKCKQFECVGCSWKDNYDVDKINDICQRIIK